MPSTNTLLSPNIQVSIALRRWLPLAVMLTGTFMVTLDFFIVNVAIPSMQQELGAGSAAIEWIAAGYGLTYAALLITGGRLGDLHGRRRIFLFGLALFTAASAACGAATGVRWLIAARIAQGAGAALLVPQVLAIVGTIYSGDERNRAFAAYGVVLGLASACGQVIGGLLIQADLLGLGWRTCFLVNIPVGAMAMLLATRTVPESRIDARRQLDLPGAALVTSGLAALLLPLIEGRSRGWPLWTWLCFAAACGLFAALAWQQRGRAARGESPLLDPALFRIGRFRTGLLAVLALFGGVASFFFVLAFYLQRGRLLDPLVSGLVFTALAVAFSATSLAAGRTAQRRRTPPLCIGALGMAVGLAALWLVVRVIGVGGSPLALLPPLLIDGAGMGLVMAPLVATVLAGLPNQHAGTAAGILATAQQCANALGVAVLGLVFFGVLGRNPTQSTYASAFNASLVCLIALAVLLAAITTRLRAGPTE